MPKDKTRLPKYPDKSQPTLHEWMSRSAPTTNPTRSTSAPALLVNTTPAIIDLSEEENSSAESTNPQNVITSAEKGNSSPTTPENTQEHSSSSKSDIPLVKTAGLPSASAASASVALPGNNTQQPLKAQLNHFLKYILSVQKTFASLVLSELYYSLLINRSGITMLVDTFLTPLSLPTGLKTFLSMSITESFSQSSQTNPSGQKRLEVSFTQEFNSLVALLDKCIGIIKTSLNPAANLSDLQSLEQIKTRLLTQHEKNCQHILAMQNQMLELAQNLTQENLSQIDNIFQNMRPIKIRELFAFLVTALKTSKVKPDHVANNFIEIFLLFAADLEQKYQQFENTYIEIKRTISPSFTLFPLQPLQSELQSYLDAPDKAGKIPTKHFSALYNDVVMPTSPLSALLIEMFYHYQAVHETYIRLSFVDSYTYGNQRLINASGISEFDTILGMVATYITNPAEPNSLFANYLHAFNAIINILHPFVENLYASNQGTLTAWNLQADILSNTLHECIQTFNQHIFELQNQMHVLVAAPTQQSSNKLDEIFNDAEPQKIINLLEFINQMVKTHHTSPDQVTRRLMQFFLTFATDLEMQFQRFCQTYENCKRSFNPEFSIAPNKSNLSDYLAAWRSSGKMPVSPIKKREREEAAEQENLPSPKRATTMGRATTATTFRLHQPSVPPNPFFGLRETTNSPATAASSKPKPPKLRQLRP